MLISGERAPITLALLQGLEHGITAFNGMSPAEFAASENQKSVKSSSTWRDAERRLKSPSCSSRATQYVAEHGGTGAPVSD